MTPQEKANELYKLLADKTKRGVPQVENDLAGSIIEYYQKVEPPKAHGGNHH